MSVHSFPGNNKPTPKSLEAAEKFIEKKRSEHVENSARREAQYNGMIDSLSEGLGGFGLKAIEMGDTVIHLDEPNHSLSQGQAEVNLTTHLNQGLPLAVLKIWKSGSYYQDEQVEFKAQSLETLIDVEKVHTLAPTSKIYGPNDALPWSQIMAPGGISIFIQDAQEFEALWAHLKEWVHTDWHDNIMKQAKFFHKAENVWGIGVDFEFAPDLSWRIAQWVQSEKQLEAVEDEGEWNSLAQQELKKTVTSLVALEAHPGFGEVMTDLLEKIKPCLAKSMDGKKQLKVARDKSDKALAHLHEGYSSYQVDFNKWTPAIPQDFFIPKAPPVPKGTQKKM